MDDWDVFIAYAGGDAVAAGELYRLLVCRCRPFLDTECIELGEDWDATLQSAQASAAVSVVLVSERTRAAFYQREEVAHALALARDPERSHRVVPVFLDGTTDVPYGLRLKHGLNLASGLDMADVASRIETLLGQMRRSGDDDRPITRPSRTGGLCIDDVSVSTGKRHVELDVRIRNAGTTTVNITRASVNIEERVAYAGTYQKSASYDLKIDGNRNEVSVAHVLAPGEVDRFVLRLGFTKINSGCGFVARISLRYNGDMTAESEPFTFSSTF